MSLTETTVRLPAAPTVPIDGSSARIDVPSLSYHPAGTGRQQRS